jgi:CysZ protein
VTLQVKNTSLTEPPEVSKISLRVKSIWLFYRGNCESQWGDMFHFIRGLTYVLRGATFLKTHPILLKYVLIPFIINVLVFSLIAYLGWHYGEIFLNQMIHRGEAWYWSLLFYLSLGLLGLLLVLIIVFTFTIVGTLIAAPFNEVLSEKTEEILLGRLSKNSEGRESFFSDLFSRLHRVSSDVVENLKEIAFFALVGFGMFFLNFIPGLGTGLNTLWIWIFLAFEFLSYPLNRRHYPFRQKLRIIWDYKGLALGFGLGVFLIFLVPLLNFICIPISVIGGTLLYLQEMEGTIKGK